MKVKIEFEVQAEERDSLVLAADLLQELVNRLDANFVWPTKVLDENGNSVGTVEVSDE